jgi:hypothetical protein
MIPNHEGHPPRGRWAHLLFRVAATAAAVLAAAQSVIAGGFMQGHYSMLAAHAKAATYLALALLVTLVAAVLLWRPGRGPGRPAVLCAVALVLCGAQIVVGYTRELIIHVPLAVVLIGLVIQIAVLSWRLPLGTAATVAGRQQAENPAVRA